MQDNIIDMIIPTPKLESTKCKLFAHVIWFFLKFSSIIITLISWYLYDYFIAFFTFILAYIIIGIIRANIRNISIPKTQQEYPYTDKAIVAWYVDKELCF